ncbi:hypothetical protein SAMN05216436_11985 [bacterium A37T11]|nr:hypothetical protein SAMN05216436_11985 [bacterium A37T11]
MEVHVCWNKAYTKLAKVVVFMKIVLPSTNIFDTNATEVYTIWQLNGANLNAKIGFDFQIWKSNPI